MTSAASVSPVSVSDQADRHQEERLPLADVLATLAHELRQPLSNIESIAYYLSMVLPQGDARAQSELARIRQLVEQSSAILTNSLRRAGYVPPLDLSTIANDAPAEPLDAFDPRQMCLMLDTNVPADVA